MPDLSLELSRLLRISGIRWVEFDRVGRGSGSQKVFHQARDLWGDAFSPQLIRIDFLISGRAPYALFYVEGFAAEVAGTLHDLLPVMHRVGVRSSHFDFGAS